MQTLANRDSHTLDIWGTNLSIKEYQKTTNSRYLENFKELITKYEHDLDPDCFYRHHTKCDCEVKENKEIASISANLEEETLKYFNPLYSGRRDYGGLSQGFILEKFSKKIGNVRKDLLVDFGKDFLIYGPSEKSITVSDPFMPKLPLAQVKVTNGILLSSWDKESGGKYKKIINEHFQFIILKANLDFSATRLDAWSTALIIGGHNLLSHLKTIPKYKNKWEYVYYDKKLKKLICSENTICKKGKNSYYEIKFL